MLKRLFILCFFNLFVMGLMAQKAAITAGPMPGYTTHREVNIWVQVVNTSKVSLVYWAQGRSDDKDTLKVLIDSKNQSTPYSHHFIVENLQPGTPYKYVLILNGKGTKSAEFGFKTQALWEHRGAPPAFSFMLGSCNYVNDSAYDRPGKPYGSSQSIFTHMNEVKTDFMLWLGDNTYLREADYDSKSGCRYRYQHTRSRKELQPFLQSRHHYAIWDDHDFGPNDVSGNYFGKNWTRDLFTEYWANRTYGENNQGIYSNYTWNDAEFFLLDDRWFRDPDASQDTLNKSILGNTQFKWLLNGLLESKATFKFIVSGNQVINKYTEKESFNQFQKERDSLISFISQNEISGVIFLSGDRHHTEMLKWERPLPQVVDTVFTKNQIEKTSDKEKEKKDKKKSKEKPKEEIKVKPTTDDDEPMEIIVPRTERYPLYELTSSPLTSGTSSIKLINEFSNPQRIGPTLVVEPNFCTISINGFTGNRSILFKCFGAQGELKWELTLNEEQLK